jgi:tetratricopeptide (TPR) repeat protein
MPVTHWKVCWIGLIVTVNTSFYAQSSAGGLPPVSTGDIFTSSQSPNSRSDNTLPSMTNLSGKVMVDDGAPIVNRVLIESNCHGVVRAEGYTDSKGAFSIQFSNKEFGGANLASETPATHLDPNAIRQNSARDWRDCELKAVLPGFVSQTVDLGIRTPSIGNTNIGTIVLHHAATVEGSTISATGAGVPNKARKDFEKGLAETKNGKLDSAQERFEKAVEAYPAYAQAWLELGRVQAQKNDGRGARQSFYRSIEADSKFVSPYRELAQLAGHDKQWQELADTTDQLLKLDALNFPEAWFYNCVAKFHLENFDAAENSARQGIRIDTERRIPKLEYVLGTVLAQKGDYQGAAEHLHKYLSLSPNAPDAADTKKKLEEVEKLSAASPTPKE